MSFWSKINPKNWIKNYIKEKVIDNVIIFLFEKLPILTKLNGYKEGVSELAKVLTVLLAVVNQYFYDIGFELDEATVTYFITSFFQILGRYHARLKTERQLDRKTLETVTTSEAVDSYITRD